MTFKQDDTLFTQSTFLEGCELPHSDITAAQGEKSTAGSSRETDFLEISQKQVSWFAACTLLGSFLLFSCGYQVGKLQKSCQSPMTSDLLVPDALAQPNAMKISSLGHYTVYEDAVLRCNELRQQGKVAVLTKKMSRSVAGVERFWYLVTEGEKTMLKGNLT